MFCFNYIRHGFEKKRMQICKRISESTKFFLSSFSLAAKKEMR